MCGAVVDKLGRRYVEVLFIVSASGFLGTYTMAVAMTPPMAGAATLPLAVFLGLLSVCNAIFTAALWAAADEWKTAGYRWIAFGAIASSLNVSALVVRCIAQNYLDRSATLFSEHESKNSTLGVSISMILCATAAVFLGCGLACCVRIKRAKSQARASSFDDYVSHEPAVDMAQPLIRGREDE